MTTINQFMQTDSSATGTNATYRVPRWVECADVAAEALERGEIDKADAWMRLACIYRDGSR